MPVLRRGDYHGPVQWPPAVAAQAGGGAVPQGSAGTPPAVELRQSAGPAGLDSQAP